MPKGAVGRRCEEELRDMKRTIRRAILVGVLGLTVGPVTVNAQPAGASPPASPDQQADLARKLANPISDLVSVPFQFNWEQNVGPNDETRFVLNVQPVIPFSISRDWNMITRVIVPLVSQPPLFDGGAPASGVSDIVTSFFFSPKAGGLIWGVGPVVSLPSTSAPTLGTGKWSVGPTVVVLKQAGSWTVGALWNQVWSFAGNAERNDVNQMFLQPFLAYQATRTVTLTIQSETSANWEVDEDRWTVPINVLVSKLSTFGVFPASYQLGVGGYPKRPAIGPSWKIRGAIVILLPRR
jgi:hypothetical protein